ncbi:MAG: CAP domain-containing protein, partial [Solirubrobacteraceae bacterium]
PATPPPRARRVGGAADRAPGASGHRRARRAGGAIVAAAAAGLLAAPSAQAAGPGVDADMPPAPLGSARTATAQLCLTNLERAAAGLNTVTPSPLVALAAQRHVDDMVARRYFAHDAPLPAPFGISPSLRLSAAGYVWSAMGENLAVGQTTPRAVVTAWLKSKGHCENLMSIAYRVAGFGVSLRGTGDFPGPTWSQTFARGLFADAPGGPQVACPRGPAVRVPNVNLLPGPVADPGPTDGPEAAPEAVAGGRGGSGGGARAGSTSGDRIGVTARRTTRRLRLRVTLPEFDGRRVVRVTIRQSGERKRVKRWRRSGGRTWTLKVTARSARKGKVTVRANGRQRTTRFR